LILVRKWLVFLPRFRIFKQGGAEFKIPKTTQEEDWKSFYNVDDRIMCFDPTGRKQVFSAPFDAVNGWFLLMNFFILYKYNTE
jgi:hypothetical protein